MVQAFAWESVAGVEKTDLDFHAAVDETALEVLAAVE